MGLGWNAAAGGFGLRVRRNGFRRMALVFKRDFARSASFPKMLEQDNSLNKIHDITTPEQLRTSTKLVGTAGERSLLCMGESLRTATGFVPVLLKEP